MPNSRLHEFNFSKKIWYLIWLVRRFTNLKKLAVDNVNIDQISFIIGLMKGYDESKLIDLETIKDKSYFPSVFLTKTQRIFLDAEKDPNKGIKNFFPSKFKEYLPKDKQGVLLNAMQLYDYRNKIIKLFENKDINVFYACT